MMARQWSALLILVLLVPLALPGLAAARPDSVGSPAVVDPQILVEMGRAPDGRTSFFILLREQADLSPAYQIQDWEARGRFVYDRLRETAELSQAEVRGWLDERGVSYRSFAIDNSLFITADRQVLQDLSAFPAVASFRANYQRALAPRFPAPEASPQATVPWNIAMVGANRVWRDFGVRGQGIVVADIGSGVDYTHEALFPNYRCGNGPHADCWYDPIGGCPDAPCDTNTEGTLYMGIMAGDDAYTLTYSAGMAPDAQWIACRGCTYGNCTDYTLNACADWLLAPNGNPANRPHIVNNGWGGGSCDTWFQTQVQAWRAAGIFPVFSAGEPGPGCATIDSPAAYAEAWTTGATDKNDNITDWSPRGPSPCGGVLKPEVSAPGDGICTTVPGNDWSCYISGISFASPHSAGLVALLWSAEPALVGDYLATAQVITSTAFCRDDPSCGGGPCPEPNNTYGWGRIDAYAAVRSVAAPLPQIVVEPAMLDSTQEPDRIIQQTLWIVNAGAAPLTFTLSEYTQTVPVGSMTRPAAGSVPAGSMTRPAAGSWTRPELTRLRATPVVDARLQGQVQSAGRARAIIYLRELPDLSAAYAIHDWAARGRYVYEQLQQSARRNAATLMDRLEAAGAEPRLFPAGSAIAATVDASLLDEIAARPEVASIGPDVQLALAPEVLGEPALAPETVEWNIAQIGADRAWSQLGVTGQGVVVGNIGTGVMYTHPALINQYRGNLGGGNFDHNYSWFDFVGGQPAPYDDASHSTFGMGIAVGDDGSGNQVGVAPGARWVAAKACNSGFACSEQDLLAAMDWMLAPTDLSGSNPRPELRPQVVLSMWGFSSCDSTFRVSLQSWRAAGMLPVFAPGGGGPGCETIASPADMPESFTAGATDNNDIIAGFSPRGPSCSSFGNEIKPEVAAPGVNVRSANNTGGYQTGSGTAWSAAHLAGAAALVYSADPMLGGDGVESMIDNTAFCRTDTTCGGADCYNNTYGWGRVDAFAAVSLTLAGAGDAVPWLDATPLTGTLDPGQRVPVAVTFDSTGVPEGVYRAGLAVASNDPNRPQVDVPVTMTVSSCIPVSGDFSRWPIVPTAGQPFTLSASADGTQPIAYNWDLGDGTTATGPLVSHTYAEAGTFTVILTLANPCSQANVAYTVSVAPAPEPSRWVVEQVDAPKLFNNMGNRSLAVDTSGHPHVAYGQDFLYYAWHDGTAWRIETVDGSGNTGFGTSLVLDTNKRPHIAYVYSDDVVSYLKYASYDGSAWRIETVDNSGQIGQPVTLVLDSQGRPHISYLDGSGDKVKYAYYDGTIWQIKSVLHFDNYGVYPSLALDSLDLPHISYYGGFGQGLEYASYDGTAWYTETVDTETYSGWYTSLVIDSLDRPHIGYCDWGNWDVKYAYYDGAVWQSQVVDNDDVGEYVSLALDSAGRPRLSYRQWQDGDLRYAHLDQGYWYVETVDPAGDGGWDSSLALDSAGLPYITHYSIEVPGMDGGALRYAHFDGSSWQVDTMDQSADVGYESSLALDHANQPHISYIDSTLKDLKYAHRGSAGWHTETVESAGDVGTDTSLALDSANRPHISYVGGSDLRYAYLDGASWHIETVDSAGSAGLYSSLALDAQDLPHISYYELGQVYSLKYAYSDGMTWHIEVVTTTSFSPWDSSLALDDAGHPHIVFPDIQHIHYAYYDGTAWQFECIERSNVGTDASLALDTAGRPHVSYYATWPADALRYAYYDGTAWQKETVDNVGDNGLYSSIFVDAAGHPHISYCQYHTEYQRCDDLKYAYYDGTAWQIETVDRAGYLGYNSSIVVDTFGQPHISYYDYGNADLKYATIAQCAPLSGVAIDGPTTLPAGVTGSFTAAYAPPTATLPVDISWDNGTLGPTAVYSWTVPGSYVVAVTAANCGATVTATQAVVVTPAVCEPVTAVDISWQPPFPVVGQVITLTGAASGTLPMAYSWSFGDGSTGSGQAVSHVYSGVGSYQVDLTATNACASAQATAQLDVAPPLGAHVIALLAFDNDLAPYASEVIERFRLGTAANPGVRATLLVDLNGDNDSEVVEVAGGVVTHTQSIPWLPGVHEVDTASGPVLSAFLQWARSQYPADRTMVSLMGHGVGLSPEVTWPQGLQSQLPPLPQFRDRTSGDMTSGTYLSTPELGRALAEATGNGAAPFDLLFLDQCFQGNLDVLYEVRSSAAVFVASPNYAWAAFAYDRYLPYLTSTVPAEETAQAIQAEYEAALDDTHPNAIVWVHAADVASLAAAVSNLGDALRGELGGSRELILDAALQSRFVDTTLCAGDLDLCPPDELMGLGSFARALQARFPSGSAVHAAAGLVLAQLANVHGAYRTGNPWVKPESSWAYTDTLTILAPLTPTLSSVDSWRASIYTETAPLSAVWAPAPDQTVTVLAPLALAVDGRWDDFISAWYGPLTPTVGQLCRATPPAMVFDGSPSLTLTVKPQPVGAELEWGAYGPADHYGIFVLRPDGTTWEVLAMTPPGRESYQHYESLLPAGPYRYLVAARNAQGDVLALSKESTVAVGITAITPTWGYYGIPVSLSISGTGFTLPLTVTLNGSTLTYDLVNGRLLVAEVPGDVAVGPHSVGLATPMGRTILYGGYTVVQPVARVYLPFIVVRDEAGRR